MNQKVVFKFHFIKNGTNRFNLVQNTNGIELDQNLMGEIFKKYSARQHNQIHSFQLENHNNLVENIRDEFGDLVEIRSLVMDERKIKFFMLNENEVEGRIRLQCSGLERIMDQDEPDTHFEIRGDGHQIVFDISKYRQVIEQIEKKCPKFELKKLPPAFLKIFDNNQASETDERIDEAHLRSRIHKSVYEKLKEFQLESVLFGVKKNARFM
jgi:hypothetical protein